jgi:hypothetical protein
MDIAFIRSRSDALVDHLYHSSGRISEQSLFFLHHPHLQQHSDLHRVFAATEPTPEGICQFVQAHADLDSSLDRFIFADTETRLLAVFDGDGAGRTAENDVAREILTMRRYLQLWEMVQQHDQEKLARHIRLEPDPRSWPTLVYDSHPELPPDQQPPPPDFREVKVIATFMSDPELLRPLAAKLLSDALARMLNKPSSPEADLPPVTPEAGLPPVTPEHIMQAARTHLLAVINGRLKGELDGQIVADQNRPGRLTLHVVPRTLRVALWVQFAEEVVGENKYAQCRLCRGWFLKAAHKDKVYCTEKCKVQAHRDRQKALKLKKAGMPPEQIAAQIGRDLETVKGWIRLKRKKK